MSQNRESSLQELYNQFYVNKDNVLMVHLVKRSCHWYYQSLSRYVAPQGEVFAERIICSINLGATVKRCCKELIVAMIFTGTLKSFMFNSTVRNLISPLVKNKGWCILLCFPADCICKCLQIKQWLHEPCSVWHFSSLQHFP